MASDTVSKIEALVEEAVAAASVIPSPIQSYAVTAETAVAVLEPLVAMVQKVLTVMQTGNPATLDEEIALLEASRPRLAEDIEKEADAASK
jgi:hypothetical protein